MDETDRLRQEVISQTLKSQKTDNTASPSVGSGSSLLEESLKLREQIEEKEAEEKAKLREQFTGTIRTDIMEGILRRK